MCQACVDACRELFPSVPSSEMFAFLMDTTCFPAGNPEQVRQNLEENRSRMKTCDYRECYEIADADLNEASRPPSGDKP